MWSTGGSYVEQMNKLILNRKAHPQCKRLVVGREEAKTALISKNK